MHVWCGRRWPPAEGGTRMRRRSCEYEALLGAWMDAVPWWLWDAMGVASPGLP